MLTRELLADRVAVTFHLDIETPVSVVGDFNGWNPLSDPLTSLVGGLRSRTIELEPGTYAFRYLADGGNFFDDENADEIVDNGIGGTHSVIVVNMFAIEVTEPTPASDADELERIEGVGPKIAAALRASGITTFARLAASNETELKASLSFAGIRFAPSLSTWAEQSGLLASGNEAEFLKLTDALIAGRKAK